ncbi:hypothetical protein IKG20_00800 [Candidatus Saccharibacteria bacterium]|nr:hypothetical protein [Candidatus Saccharibacteria bacterium]
MKTVIEEDDFLNKFRDKDREKLKSFFGDLEKKINVRKKDKEKIIGDFEDYISYLSKRKKVADILKLLDLTNFEKAYSKNNNWYPLDTSSKIYPVAMRKDWMSIYRLSYYLDKPVVPEVLQLALTYTMIRFPLLRTSVRKGFFWNYLDGISKHFEVEKESTMPCSRINIDKFNTQAFRVCFYSRRISCEFFHVLADASGGMVFLTTLVNEYLRLLGDKVSFNECAVDVRGKIDSEELEDAFLKNHKKAKGGNLVEEKALQIDGRPSVLKPCQILHFDLDFQKVHDLSKKNDVTINELFLAFLFQVLSYSTSRDGKIQIQVPINMRKYYPTKTLRNYSLYNTICIDKNDIYDFDKTLKLVKTQSRKKITKEETDKVAYNAIHLIKSIRFIPLFIKHPIANFIYSYLGDKSSTTVLSNLGKIDIPKEMRERVRKADFVLGTSRTNRILFSVVTVNNIVTLTLSKSTTNKAVENNLYNLLKEYDLVIGVHGSEEYESKK